jgi:FkbM family methyltransferase
VRNTIKSNIIRALPPRMQVALILAKTAILSGGLSFSARAGLVLQAPRLLTHRTRSTDLRLMLPGGPLYLGRESFYIDALVLNYLWNKHVFSISCRDRVVVDLGAHKGYFGALALNQGASFVISCEPESRNFEVLERIRAENSRSVDWEVMRVAVGRDNGEISIFVSPESWAHSIYREMVTDAVTVERVEMITLAAVLQRACERRPSHGVVIKLNVEGSAGPILMAASRAVLVPVVAVELDYEPGSHYDIAELRNHLEAAGLDQVSLAGESLWVFSRSDSKIVDETYA